jgi:hypothetical protein
MRKLILLAGLVCLGVLSAVVPANATDQSTAVKLCEKNPNCTQTNVTGGKHFNVGTNEIYCPDKGQCECVICTHTRRQPRSFGFILRPQFVVPQSLSGPGSDSSPAAAPPAPPPSGGPIL